jgi:KEOPS complex subunit Cgi121
VRLVEGRADVDDVPAFVEELAGIAAAHDVVVQAFDARYVAGREHLEAAVRSARRALANDDGIADDPPVEILLYAAGRRQIDRALTIGVEEGQGPVVVVVDGHDDGDEAAAAGAVEARLEPTATLGVARDEAGIRTYFDIGDAELAATDASLVDLVVERVALLAVEK